MNTDLEDLIRSTLHERAGAIDDGPRWRSAPARGPRRWPAVAAAVAAVLVVGTGSAWLLTTSKPGPAADGAQSSCDAALPRSWQNAIDGPAYSIDGYTPPVDGVFADGSAVAAPIGRGFDNELLQLRTDGSSAVLYRPPAGSYASSTDLDADTLVANIPTISHNTSGPGVADIVAVDSRTRHVRHLLDDAPAGLRPRKIDTQAVGDAVVQAGTVYWTVDGHGARRGSVVGYDLRTHRYRTVATYTGRNYVVRDARGVYWRGGSVLAPHLPARVAELAAHTTQQSFHDTFVVTDGRHYAWARGNTIYWAGPDGAHAEYTPGRTHPGGFGPYSVAGRFVLTNTPGEPGTYHLLDARTGAVAALHIKVGGSVASVGSMLYLIRPVTWGDGRPGNKTIPIDTAELPKLRC